MNDIVACPNELPQLRQFLHRELAHLRQ